MSSDPSIPEREALERAAAAGTLEGAAAREALGAVAERVLDGVIVVSGDARVVTMNRRARLQLGLDADTEPTSIGEIDRQYAAVAGLTGDKPSLSALWQACIEADDTKVAKVLFSDRADAMPIRVVATPLPGAEASKPGVILILQSAVIDIRDELSSSPANLRDEGDADAVVDLRSTAPTRGPQSGPDDASDDGDQSVELGEPEMMLHALWDRARARVTAIDVWTTIPSLSADRWPWAVATPIAQPGIPWCQVDRLVLEHSIELAATIRARTRPRSSIRVGIRLSASSLMQPDLVEVITRSLKVRRLGPESVYFQLCEHQIPADLQLGAWLLARLHAVGIPIVLDEFGTTDESLERLVHLHISEAHVACPADGTAPDSLSDAIGRINELGFAPAVRGISTPSQLGDALRLGAVRVEGPFLAAPLDTDTAIERLVDQAEHPGLVAARRGIFLADLPG